MQLMTLTEGMDTSIHLAPELLLQHLPVSVGAYQIPLKNGHEAAAELLRLVAGVSGANPPHSMARVIPHLPTFGDGNPSDKFVWAYWRLAELVGGIHGEDAALVLSQLAKSNPAYSYAGTSALQVAELVSVRNAALKHPNIATQKMLELVVRQPDTFGPMKLVGSRVAWVAFAHGVGELVALELTLYRDDSFAAEFVLELCPSLQTLFKFFYRGSKQWASSLWWEALDRSRRWATVAFQQAVTNSGMDPVGGRYVARWVLHRESEASEFPVGPDQWSVGGNSAGTTVGIVLAQLLAQANIGLERVPFGFQRRELPHVD